MSEELYGLTGDDREAIRRVVARDQQQAPETGAQAVAGPWKPSPDIIGKADAAISQGATGTVSIWRGASSSTLTDSTVNIQAYARVGDVSSGAWVYVRRFPCGWEIYQTECA